MNPFKQAAGNGRMVTKTKVQEPHVRGKLHEPSHKTKVRMSKSPPAPMPRKGSPRMSAIGKDSKMGNTFPGKEPSGIQKARKGASRFGNQGSY